MKLLIEELETINELFALTLDGTASHLKNDELTDEDIDRTISALQIVGNKYRELASAMNASAEQPKSNKLFDDITQMYYAYIMNIESEYMDTIAMVKDSESITELAEALHTVAITKHNSDPLLCELITSVDYTAIAHVLWDEDKPGNLN